MFSLKKRILLISWVCALTCLFSYNSFAQNLGHIIFDTSNGLVSDEVYDIEIGDNGLIWITTDRGVQSYDGYNFTNYSTANGLADNVNFEIFEDNEGVIWLNGYNSKISYIKDGKCYIYDKNHELKSILKDNNLLWPSNILNIDSTIYVVAEGSSNARLISYKEGVFNIQSKSIKDTINGEAFQYFELNDFILSFHTRNIRNKTFLYSRVCEIKHSREVVQNELSILLKHPNYEKTVDIGSRIEFINNDEESKIWVGTIDGLVSIDINENYKISRYFYDELITCIKRDGEGNYWMSTIESGLFLIPSFDFVISDLAMLECEEDKILSLSSIGEYLIAGTSGGKIVSEHINGDKSVVYDFDDNGFNINRLERVNDQQVNSNIGRIWKSDVGLNFSQSIGYFQEYAYQNDYTISGSPIGFVVKKYGNKNFSSKDFLEPIGSKVNTFFIKKNYFLTGSHTGLYLTKEIDFLGTKEIKFNGQSIGRVSDITQNEDQQTFILTMNNGIFLYNDGKLTLLTDDPFTAKINCGIFDKSIFWIGTNEGLFKFKYIDEVNEPKLVKVKQYTFEDGLNSNFINDLEIWQDKLWIASNKGICSYDFQLSKFVPDEVPLFLDRASANDTIDIVDEMELEYTANDIKISYRGVSMKKDRIEPFYKFRLIKNGTVTFWKNTNSNEIFFDDIEPGQYKFEVKAQNSAGTWNKNPKSISFTIAPHFTDRLWFKLLAFVLLFGGVISYFLWLIRRNKRRFLIREKMKQIELDARESELSLLRNQMNPHFIFNALNSIQNLIFKKDDIKANQYLTTFGSLIRSTLDYTKKKKITLHEEIDFTKRYLELEHMRFPDKFDYAVENVSDLDLHNLKVPPLLLQPIVENAIIHVFKGIDYPGSILIRLMDVDRQRFEIVISDNGLGFFPTKSNKKHKSIGLNLIKERLDIINQNLGQEIASIDIANNEGTIVTISLPK